MASSGLFFFFPFLRFFLKLGMQTLGSLYFGGVGLLLGAVSGWFLNQGETEFSFSWKLCAVGGGLAGTFLGSILAGAYFKPMGARSDFMVWVRSVFASVTLTFFSLSAAGFAAVFIHLIRLNEPIAKALGLAVAQGMKNFGLFDNPKGWVMAVLVFVSGIGFRAILDALDGAENRGGV